VKAETYSQSLTAFGEQYLLKRKEYLRASDYFILYNTREKKISDKLNVRVENDGLNKYFPNTAN
jgi:hypothetical protein